MTITAADFKAECGRIGLEIAGYMLRRHGGIITARDKELAERMAHIAARRHPWAKDVDLARQVNIAAGDPVTAASPWTTPVMLGAFCEVRDGIEAAVDLVTGLGLGGDCFIL